MTQAHVQLSEERTYPESANVCITHLQVARHRLHRTVDLGLLGEDSVAVPGPGVPALREVSGDLQNKKNEK